ncbi:DUF1501 domain-containing protein [Phragmitibacter flavus]|uniref:DUF1501 domain-containing protein n=1 Tax=Phragmitibacter flavus TaxID=2576071 RepID=A0A5R8KIT9_9BACT|nr:DUF1501 domain-containing protein [Phragmitibacter flavus]TLD72202.1 DUF1501 domain-containing protein [Phragmitibacter flavus]
MKMHPLCQGNHIDLSVGHSRREFLYTGLIGGMGLSLPMLMKLQAEQKIADVPSVAAKADSIIHIYLPGGIAHQESWDPKPFASADYRGPLGSIKTKIPGVAFSEHFKKTAEIADKLTIIRSMTHGEAAHERGTHNMLTGYRPSPAIKYPSFGSVVSHELGVKNSLPPYVVVPNMFAPENGTGYLSTAYGPFALGSDPAASNFSVRDLALPKDVSEARFNRRRTLLESVDAHFSSVEKSDALTAMDSFYQNAYGLISSKAAREAFNLEAEAGKLRDEYGRNQAGQRFLMARRLVEAGVRLVTVNYGGWDHHSNIKAGFASNAPQFDIAFARLIRDLEERGMLDRTLVLVSSEFGRTPKINSTNGRDHYPRVFSVAMAGGGVKRGLVYGSSDALGGEPAENPVGPESLAKTMYHLVGINAEKRLMADGGRPIDIVNGGELIKDILA